MNLPNALTLSRIFFVPLLVVVLLTAPATWHTMWPSYDERLVLGVPKEMLAAAIFGLASLTDWLDGYLARRRKQITPLGQMMDPLADKLLTSAAFISLVQMEKAPAWMVAVIIGRELAITALRSIGYNRGVSLPASRLGKVKMVAEVVAILALILGRQHLGPVLYLVGPAALWLAMILAVVSGVDYYRRFMRGQKSELRVEN
jgi:CDP-diacylglycerol--glycerol-3-phosphate 3-phosphatidyltransferase